MHFRATHYKLQEHSAFMASRAPKNPREHETVAEQFVVDMLERAANAGKEVAIAFSGGKESIVLLHLVARAAHTLKLNPWPHVFHATRLIGQKEVGTEVSRLIRDLDCFVDVFCEQEEYQSFPLCTVHATSIEGAMRAFLGDHQNVGYVFTGARVGEDLARALKTLKYGPLEDAPEPTMHVAPLLGWNDSQIWDYIGARHLPHPDAYAQGYTSVGSAFMRRGDTEGRSPLLRRPDGTFLHARHAMTSINPF